LRTIVTAPVFAVDRIESAPPRRIGHRDRGEAFVSLDVTRTGRLPHAQVDELLRAGWPRFSDGERARRRAALAQAASAQGCDLVIVYGADRAGTAVQWLSGWPVTREAALVIDLRSGGDVLFVDFHNHVPLATELGEDCEVRWAGPSMADTLVEELSRRGAAQRRVGLIGPVAFGLHARLVEAAGGAVPMGAAYTRLRLVKSDEELDRLRVGAHLSDLAVLALRDGLRPGLVDHELSDLVERAYVPLGGTTHIHYFGITSMAAPGRGAPAQYTTGRKVCDGDVVVTEISAAFQGYSGQVLRTMTTAAELTPMYRDLHAVADAAFDAVCKVLRPGITAAEIVDASGVIEDAGYTIVDDLVHGFGGGYLPPVLGSRSRPAGPLPDLKLEAGMTLVVQPNVTTLDRRAGVQTGELMLVTESGAESLHGVPRGPWVGVGRPG
jgi:Xaa-Pro dipeptidase